MKLYIPTYKRANTITTHKLLGEYFDTIITVHDPELAIPYNQAGIPVIISNTPRGVANARQWIWDQVPDGEWFLMADDNITDILVNDVTWTSRMDEYPWKYHSNVKFFIDRIPELIEEAESIGAKTVGFALTNNEYFAKKKYNFIAHISNKMVLMKKNNKIKWNLLGDLVHSMEEMNITAQQHLFFGAVVRCNYISPVAEHYAEGGIGTYPERRLMKMKDSAILYSFYKGFFRWKKDDDLSLAFHEAGKLNAWRKNMYKRLST